GLGGGACETSPEKGSAVAGEERFGLVLVETHRAARSVAVNTRRRGWSSERKASSGSVWPRALCVVAFGVRPPPCPKITTPLAKPFSTAALTPWPLVKRDETVSAPADGGKPGARADHRRSCGHRLHTPRPAVEPQRRRAGVQPAFSLAVFRPIHQHVDEAVTHRPRGRERPSRSEEHTSELQSRFDLVCRLLLEKKKKTQ